MIEMRVIRNVCGVDIFFNGKTFVLTTDDHVKCKLDFLQYALWPSGWMWLCITVVWNTPRYTFNKLRRRQTEASDRLTKYTTKLFHGSWRDTVGQHLGVRTCAEPFGMLKSSTNSVFARLMNISKTLKRCKETWLWNEAKLIWKIKVN